MAEIQANGHRAEVEPGQDPMLTPLTLTFTVGDDTAITMVTTPAALEGPESDAIEHLVENFDELVLRVLAAMAAQVEEEVNRG